MNDPFLILEGRRAASWLAMRGHKIGLASPARYDQDEGGSIFKVNHDICVVTGNKITKKIDQDWNRSVPNGIILHRPGSRHMTELNALMQPGN
ncbi:MAG: hypothetical protein P1U71_11150 [Sneathiella sp.]|nr:hypothetical protein [Sneathiella sp.]